MPQKLRKIVQKVADKTGLMKHVELQTLISEEGDIVKKTQQLFTERVEAITALKTFAAAEPDEVKAAVESIAEETEGLNAAESDMISAINANYVGKLHTLLDKLGDIDAILKKKNDAVRALEKAKENVAKKEKGVEKAEASGDSAKLITAKSQLDIAQKDVEAKETESEKTAAESDEKEAAFNSDKLATLKEAFTALNDARKEFYEKALGIVSGLQEKVDSLPAEVSAPAPAAKPAPPPLAKPAPVEEDEEDEEKPEEQDTPVEEEKPEEEEPSEDEDEE
ncbi:MAG TPA: hypothetical protein VKK79_04070 [Candidatus Lokiarchaeia archaeon]|nr:hypothetical protein [Candidatus Lokiarchaeia archaeon]